ncbi:MAG TPA: hypothetical protein VJ600_06240, partial [Holophagaceae bacterium]|nr:hypothetical protein [Holophagaceae bacterium]
MNLLALPLNFGLLEGDNSFSVVNIFKEASIANKGIIIILTALLAIQIYTAIERFVMYSQSSAASDKFLKLFMDTLRRGDFEAAKRAATTHNKSHVALVLKHGLDIFQYEKQLKSMNPNHDVI